MREVFFSVEKYLTIEMDKESSVPKVYYKGEEISNKVEVSFDWVTRSDEFGGMKFSVEYFRETESGSLTKNYIETKLDKFAFDD